MVPKILGFEECFCFVSLPPPISVGGVMQDANVTQRHQANMMSLVTLQALSNDVLLIRKIKKRTLVIKIFMSIVKHG